MRGGPFPISTKALVASGERIARIGALASAAVELELRTRPHGLAGMIRSARRALIAPEPLDESDASLIASLHGSCRRQYRTGLRILLATSAFVGVWGFLVPLSGAVVVAGSLVSESSVKKVQPPAGGVIAEILAHEGETVKNGDLLARLDETAARANLRLVLGQLDATRARIVRLTAERDGSEGMPTPSESAARSGDSGLDAALTAERALFTARSVARSGQRDLLNKRIDQLNEQISGLEAQMSSQDAQRTLIAGELESIEGLYQKRLVPVSRLTTLQREAARLDGVKGQLVSSIAETRSRISESSLQVARLEQDFRAEVMKDLRDAQREQSELDQRSIAARDILDHVEIRAPTSGVVQQMAIHTVGGVVSAGEVLMTIVPTDDDLQIEGRLPPHDIDQVHVGQKTFVRLSAFNQRTTPELEGKVAFVSPDAAQDARGNAPYYLVRVSLARSEVGRLNTRLVPGMPAEIFLLTGGRTMISYLFKPLGDQFSRMFRER